MLLHFTYEGHLHVTLIKKITSKNQKKNIRYEISNFEAGEFESCNNWGTETTESGMKIIYYISRMHVTSEVYVQCILPSYV